MSNSLSKVIFVSSGVPQGSHLGPLLFNLFINDLSFVLDSSVNVLMFADDTKFYSTIKNQDGALNLQANLNKFSFWREQNKLPININKCNAISFTKKKYPIIFNYQINNININRVESVKDLGVLFNNNLSFSINTNMVIKNVLKCWVLFYEILGNLKMYLH